jgi:hypothetical protein
MNSQFERILILAKTYPSPSATHVETSCVAGITESGAMRRLYPVPFRLIEEGQQFKKWQWVNVRVEKTNKDHRPESHKIYVDGIECCEVIPTKNAWLDRRLWLDKLPTFDSVSAINPSFNSSGASLALVRPIKLLSLEITKARNSDWTLEEREKLLQQQMQGDLFSVVEATRQVKELRKIPFDFYYHYLCNTPDGEQEFKHKVVDWEAGALYWNCRKSHGDNWQEPFRAKLEVNLGSKDLMFLVGNIHRFQDQWLIISLIYPPHQKAIEPTPQVSLF